MLAIALLVISPSTHASSAAPTILALIRSGSHVVVARVDARTLKAVSGAPTSASLGSGFNLTWTYSPDGRRIAIAGTSEWIIDATSLRTRGRRRPMVDRNALVWTRSGLYETYGSLFDMLDTKGQLQDWGAGRGVAALLLEGPADDQSSTWLAIQLWPQPEDGPDSFDLPAFPAVVAFAVSSASDRAFVIARDGAAATLMLSPPRTLTVSEIALPASFATAPADASLHARWVNRNTVAVFGVGGLALIDLGSMTARLLDPQASAASVGNGTIVGWNAGGRGLSVYSSAGTLRFRALTRRRVGAVAVGDRYIYACVGRELWACKGTTFALDARSGIVAARVITPIVALVRGTERDGH